MTRSIALSLMLVAVSLFFLFAPGIAAAQQIDNSFFPGVDRIVPQCTGAPLYPGSEERQCNTCDFMALAQNLLNFALFLAVVTAGALFAWAGWLYATRAMNVGNVAKAHGIFINVVIGLVLVIGAYVIIDTIMKVLAGGEFFSNWDGLCPDNFAVQGRGTGQAR